VNFRLEDGASWWLSCVYAPQGNAEKTLFLQELTTTRAHCPGGVVGGW
jgi:hypothetical protein